MFNSLGTVLDPKKSTAKYPDARVIVLDDNFNTFQHVANCLLTIIPSMSEKRAWDLTIKVDKTGSYLNDFKFKQDDILLFGREDSGLPDSIINKSSFLISIFMPNLQTGNNNQKGVRSLNLSVACGIAIYEAHKQINFQNGN